MGYHQPKSLLESAIKIVAREASLGTKQALAYPLEKKKIYDIKWTTKNFPSEIQFHLVRELSGNDFTEFIAGHGSIENYQKFCISDDYFQNFLFHFFKEWESDEYCFLVERKLGGYWKKFQDHLKEKVLCLENEDSHTYVRVNVNKFDFATRSMGFDDPIVVQDLPSKSFLETFFLMKFERDHSFERYPAPTLPPSVLSLVPLIADYTFENNFFQERIISGAQPEFYETFKKDPEQLSEQFFFRLCAMVHSLKQFAYQETLVYASQLLETSIFYQSKYVREFHFHVWGMLAVTLAALNCQQILIFSCLDKMNKLVRIESQKWDALHYCQQVFAQLGWQTEETRVFRLFFAAVPRSSIFFKQSFKIHFDLMIKTIENMSMELIILVKRKEKAQTKNKMEHLTICINHLRKTLHLLFSKKHYTKERHRSIFQYFALVDVWDQVVQKVTDNHDSIVLEDVLRSSASGLKNSEHYMEYFLHHYANNTPWSNFEQDMDDGLDWQKSLSHSENPIVWADALFSMILPTLVFNQFHNEAHQLALDTMEIYARRKHFRTALLKDFLLATNSLLDPRAEPRTFHLPNFSSSYLKNFDFLLLLKKEPLVKHMIRFGVNSVSHYDFKP